MPKIVDHAAREVHLAEAAWRVLLRDGLARISVRTVAAEAGLAPGSLRRAFPTQDSLLVFSLELVSTRARARIQALARPHGVRETAEQLLQQFLPLDGEREVEMEVYYSLGAMALSNEALRPVFRKIHAELRAACVSVLVLLRGDEVGDLDLEAAHLHALLDGIALQLLVPAEASTTERRRAEARSILRNHLDRLPGADGAAPLVQEESRRVSPRSER
jgi:AcrR family transcriptional regulator